MAMSLPIWWPMVTACPASSTMTKPRPPSASRASPPSRCRPRLRPRNPLPMPRTRARRPLPRCRTRNSSPHEIDFGSQGRDPQLAAGYVAQPRQGFAHFGGISRAAQSSAARDGRSRALLLRARQRVRAGRPRSHDLQRRPARRLPAHPARGRALAGRSETLERQDRRRSRMSGAGEGGGQDGGGQQQQQGGGQQQQQQQAPAIDYSALYGTLSPENKEIFERKGWGKAGKDGGPVDINAVFESYRWVEELVGTDKIPAPRLDDPEQLNNWEG